MSQISPNQTPAPATPASTPVSPAPACPAPSSEVTEVPVVTAAPPSPAPSSTGSENQQRIVYKSELYVPIRRDVESFETRQRRMFESLDTRVTRRRRQWDEEMERMRSDFFRLQPSDSDSFRRQSVEDLLDGKRRLSDVFFDSCSGTIGSKRFSVSFDVGEFQPDEIRVTTENRRLKVHARHEKKVGEGRTISREFSRNIDIPLHVDDKSLQCTLSNDGILQIEAPVPVPAYDKIRNSVGSDLLEEAYHHMSSPRLETGLLTSIPTATHRSTTTTQRIITSNTGGGATTITHSGNNAVVGSSGEFKVVVDDIAGDYTADEIGVRVRDRKLLVTARHESNEPGRRCFREFCREFELPSRVRVSSLTATLEAGQLVLKAPYGDSASRVVTTSSDEHHIPVITRS